MGLFDLTTATEALTDLYDRERAAILAGRFDLLDRLGAEKERLVAAVRRNGTDAASLAGLQHRADRNAGLLQAMESGLRAAGRRIEALRQGPASLRTYDAAGQRHTISTRAASFERRS